MRINWEHGERNNERDGPPTKIWGPDSRAVLKDTKREMKNVGF